MGIDTQAPQSESACERVFEALTGNSPYPWQRKLLLKFLSGTYPPNINLPTGSGKTSIMAIWLAALAERAENEIPRRLVWIVDRRVVVDQATSEAEEIRTRLGDETNPSIQWLRAQLSHLCADGCGLPAISTLRGEREDNREWSRNPARPAIIVGTVDMIGSRLLFSGYGDGPYRRAQHAGLLGHDALIVNDEAHLTPALAKLLCRLEEKQRNKLKPFRTVRLSATHRATECWPASLEEDRSDARFRSSFESNKGLRIHVFPAGRLESKRLELATGPEPARTLIFVQSPENAHKIAGALAKEAGTSKRILTLTGTMRGFERERMTESEVFKAFAGRDPVAESCWLVATSAGEVGVNISADRLITDLDTLDHLLQRFGRLNRFGETMGIAHLLVSEKEESAGQKEGEKRKRAALDFLRALPVRPDGLHDVSPAALFGLEIPQEAIEAPPLLAPLHDWHIEVWSQTSLGSHPARPKVESWLHGKQENLPETYVAWREDVQYLVSDEIDTDDREEVFRKYRLLAHEQLRESTGKLLEKLEKLAVGGDIQFLRRNTDGKVDVLQLNEFANLPDAKRRNTTAQLAYCQLVLPPGCGKLENGMLLPEWTDQDQESTPVEIMENGAPYDVSGFQIRREQGEIKYVEHRSAFKAALRDGKWSLERLGRVSEQQYPLEFIADLKLKTLRAFAREHGWRFLLQVPLPASEDDSDSQPAALLYFAKAGERHPQADVYALDRHLRDVAEAAKKLAVELQLPSEFALALELAGEFHDLGKEAPIWQKAAGNYGSEWKGFPIAKSIKNLRGRDLNGFRHELASLLYAEKELRRRDIAPELHDLILHLIAAHHGRARPHFESKAYDQRNLKDSDRIAQDTAKRFGRLQERYGAWGLAYLESILKAADGIASGNWEDPSNA